MALPRLIIADDHPLLAEGIASIVRSLYEVVSICSNGRELLGAVERYIPDVVTFDIGMPEINGLEAARRIHAKFPRIGLVCVTQQIEAQYLQAALQAGARGFVAKHAAYAELKLALREALRGNEFITESLKEVYWDSLTLRASTIERKFDSPLTSRQREVLQMIAEGKQTKEIATALGVSVKTIEFHRATLTRALGIRSTAELTRYAVTHGIIQL